MLALSHGSNRDVAGNTKRNQLLSNTDSHRVEIVLQAVEALGLVALGIGIERLGEGGNDLGLGHGGHLPVVGVKGVAGPVHRDVAELLEHEADTVVDVTIGRAHVLHSQASGGQDGLLGPLHLGDDLLIGQGSQGVVRPGVGGQVVALSNLALDGVGVLDDVGANQEEGGRQLLGLEVVEQLGGVGRRAVVEGESPSVGGATDSDVVGSTSFASPVAPEEKKNVGQRSKIDGVW